MTVTLAASKQLLGGYTFGFAIWALMNIAAFYIALSRVGFRDAKPRTLKPFLRVTPPMRYRSIQTLLPPNPARCEIAA